MSARRHPWTRPALALAAVLLASWGSGGPAWAEEQTRVTLAPVELAAGDTARLGVRALLVPPNPCRVTLAFLDGSGAVAGGGAAQRTVTLAAAGDAGALEVSGHQLGVGLGQRIRLLPTVTFPPSPCAGAGLEATVTVTGLLGAVTATVDLAGWVGLNPQPEPPS